VKFVAALDVTTLEVKRHYQLTNIDHSDGKFSLTERAVSDCAEVTEGWIGDSFQ
jgi:hypothetical protein